MSSIDDMYRRHEKSTAERHDQGFQQQIAIWRQVAPGLIAERLAINLADPPKDYTWITTPDNGTVAAWSLCYDYGGEVHIYLFQDGRLSGPTRLTVQPYFGALYTKLDDLSAEWLGRLVSRLIERSPKDSVRLSCLIGRYWNTARAEEQRRELGYTV